MRRVPGGVVFDGGVPKPTLNLLENARVPDPDVFSVTIARTPDGEDFLVGNERVTEDELADLITAVPEAADLPVLLHSQRHSARHLFEVGPSAWDLALVLDNVRTTWQGKRVVLVTDSHFDGFDRIGQLLANYLGEEVDVSTRAVMAQGTALVSSSMTIRQRRDDGRYYLSSAHPPDGGLGRAALGHECAGRCAAPASPALVAARCLGVAGLSVVPTQPR